MTNPKLKAYGRQHIDEEDIKAVSEALRSDFLTTGPKVGEFEKKFSEYIDCKHSIAVANGTAALEIATAALQLPEGSEVIVTPLTFMADSNCLLYNSLKPVFCDINIETLNIDPEKIEEKITNKTKAIIYVDYAGRPCDIDKIKAVAKKHKHIYLIEDACHAVGGEYHGKKLGSIADMTVFSFHPVKTMTTGEGGMITTNNDEFAARARILRNHGILKNDALKSKIYGEDAFYEYDMIMLGRNYRLTDIQCALGISQLKKLDKLIEKRQQLSSYYNKLFKGVKGLTTPLAKLDPQNEYSWHLYYILLDKNINKNKFLNYMKSKGIGAHSFYIPIYNFTYYQKKLGVKKEDYPVAEEAFSRLVILPLFPDMNEKDVEEVVNCAKESIDSIKQLGAKKENNQRNVK